MKGIFILALLLLTFGGAVSAQSFLADFEKVKTIRPLESTRADVMKILKNLKTDEKSGPNEIVHSESYSNENVSVEIEYTSGECSDNESIWKVPAGKVEKIEIWPAETLRVEDFKFYLANFREEQMYFDNEDEYVYHNKLLGLAFFVNDGEIEYVQILPTPGYYSFLCDNDEDDDVAAMRDYFTTESFFGKTNLEDRTGIISCPMPVINEVKLSRKEIIVGCQNTANCENCSDGDDRIEVTTEATDPENDPLTYNYTVSGGKIIGEGKSVVWDMSKLPLGDYTITATVDDGCGVCGEPRTETVTIKRCDD